MSSFLKVKIPSVPWVAPNVATKLQICSLWCQKIWQTLQIWWTKKALVCPESESLQHKNSSSVYPVIELQQSTAKKQAAITTRFCLWPKARRSPLKGLNLGTATSSLGSHRQMATIKQGNQPQLSTYKDSWRVSWMGRTKSEPSTRNLAKGGDGSSSQCRRVSPQVQHPEIVQEEWWRSGANECLNHHPGWNKHLGMHQEDGPKWWTAKRVP